MSINTKTHYSASLAAGGALVFLALLALLHIIKPENDPSWRMISEYELGNYGWLMHVNFIIWATAALSLFVALRPHITGLAGRIGRWLLPVSALGMVLGSFFVTDPGWLQEATTTGKLHNLGGSFMILTAPFLLTLVTASLQRHPDWKPVRAVLWGLTGLVWASFIAFIVIIAAAGTSVLSPSVLVGWPNRSLVVGYSLWVAIVAWHILRLNRKS